MYVKITDVYKNVRTCKIFCIAEFNPYLILISSSLFPKRVEDRPTDQASYRSAFSSLKTVPSLIIDQLNSDSAASILLYLSIYQKFLL